MNAQDIDWTKAPEGYDYFIVDKDGKHPSDFHFAEDNLFFGTIYIDKHGYNWIGGDGRIEIFERPETKAEAIPTYLRCVESGISKIREGEILRVIEKSPETGSYEALDSNGGTWYVGAKTLSLVGIPSVTFEPYEETPEEEGTHLRCLTADASGKFTVGKTYRVIKVDKDGDYVIYGECGSGGPWYINGDDLDFVGAASVGTFEVVSGETGETDEPVNDAPKVTHLRCISSDSRDDSFSTGVTYEVLESKGDCHILMGDDKMSWAIEKGSLEFAGCPDMGRFEVVSGEPDEPVNDAPKVTHLRCISTDSDPSFSLDTVYEVLEDLSPDGGHYYVKGDDGDIWAIDTVDLEFIGDPDIGRFEVVSDETGVADSVSAEEPAPTEPQKTQPEFGDIVHVGGVAYVFVRLDSDGDYVLYDEDGYLRYTQLDEMEEYAERILRQKVLKDLKASRIGVVEDHPAYDIDITVPDLIDFILAYKDNWGA